MALELLLLAVLLISGYTDLKYRKIYNAVLFPAALLTFVIHLLDSGLAGLLFSFQGFFLGIGLLILPFLRGGLGAGDVKLLGLVGAVKGTEFVLYSFIFTALTGGAITIVLLLAKGRLRQTVKAIQAGLKVFLLSRFSIWNFAALDSTEGVLAIPYGVAIALGTIMTYWVMV